MGFIIVCLRKRPPKQVCVMHHCKSKLFVEWRVFFSLFLPSIYYVRSFVVLIKLMFAASAKPQQGFLEGVKWGTLHPQSRLFRQLWATNRSLAGSDKENPVTDSSRVSPGCQNSFLFFSPHIRHHTKGCLVCHGNKRQGGWLPCAVPVELAAGKWRVFSFK